MSEGIFQILYNDPSVRISAILFRRIGKKVTGHFFSTHLFIRRKLLRAISRGKNTQQTQQQQRWIGFLVFRNLAPK